MKKTLLTLTLLASALTLCACATTTDMATATTPPGTTQPVMDMLPTATGVIPQTTDDMMPDILPDPTSSSTTVPESTGVTSMDKVRRAVEQIEDELERLSEVDDAQVVIAGNRAAVALEFDDQYKGGIDQRLRDIVQERIDSVISGVTDVAITADATLMDALDTLGERLTTMSDMNALQSDLDAIIRKITGA